MCSLNPICSCITVAVSAFPQETVSPFVGLSLKVSQTQVALRQLPQRKHSHGRDKASDRLGGRGVQLGKKSKSATRAKGREESGLELSCFSRIVSRF